MNEMLPQPVVLLYNVRDLDRRLRIGGWLERNGIRAVDVASTGLHHSLGALLDLPGFAREPGFWLGRGLKEEMLVMFAFRGSMLRDFLDFFRQEGLEPVALKAMATPTNINWNSLELYEALRAERTQIEAAKRKRDQA